MPRKASGGGATPGAASKKAAAKNKNDDDADSPPPAKVRRLADADDALVTGDSIASLKDNFNKLVEMRLTGPEAELKKHIELAQALEAKNGELVTELKAKLARFEKSQVELEKSRRELVEQKKFVLEAQEQSRTANERANIAESELKSVRAAFDVFTSSSMDQESAERLSATLDVYKDLFGCALIVDPDNHRDVGASFFNVGTKKVARMRLKVQADRSVVFSAVANDKLLPEEFRTGDVTIAQELLPAAAAKIVSEIAKA